MPNWNIRLPWLEPIIVATVCFPCLWLTLLVTSSDRHLLPAVMIWHLVAWPIAVCFALITVSPTVWIIEKVFRLQRLYPQLPTPVTVSISLAFVVAWSIMLPAPYKQPTYVSWAIGVLSTLALRAERHNRQVAAGDT